MTLKYWPVTIADVTDSRFQKIRQY